MFNFQHFQITPNELEKKANLLLRYPTVYEISKLDVGKVNSPLHLPSNLMQFSKNKDQAKCQSTYMIR